MYCILYIIEPICTLGCTGYWTVLYSTWSKPRSRRSNLLSQVLLWSSFYSLAGGNYWNRSFYGTLFKYFKGTEAEFKEFELRRWTAKNQLQQSAGSNIEKFKRNQFCLNRTHIWNSLNSASGAVKVISSDPPVEKCHVIVQFTSLPFQTMSD